MVNIMIEMPLPISLKCKFFLVQASNNHSNCWNTLHCFTGFCFRVSYLHHLTGAVPADAVDVDHEFMYKNFSFAQRCLSDGLYVQEKPRMDEKKI